MGGKTVRFLCSLCLVFAASLMIHGPVFAAQNLVAKVGSVPISQYELANQFQKVLPLQGNFHGGVSAEKRSEILQQALDELIEQAYKVQFAISEEISVDNSVVDEKMASLKGKYSSPEEFQKALGPEGERILRASLYRQLLAKKAEEIHVTARVDVSDDEVKAYYESNKTRFMQPRSFRASHILIRVDPSSNAEERKEILAKAEALLKRAKSGEDFYNLAYYNSEDRTKYVGGDLGFFHEGQTLKAFEKELLTLKPGEISDLVKTRFGFHIIKLVDVKEARQLDYEEMAGKIRGQLEKEEHEKLYAGWIEELEARYPVERY